MLPNKGMGGFSAEEMSQMRDLFGLSEADHELLVGSCAFVFEQAAHTTVPPETLRLELIGAGVAEAHARVFSSVWEAGAAECVRQLKERAVLAPEHLNAVDWSLCIHTGGSDGTRAQTAHSLLQLEVASASPDGSTLAREPLHMQMDAARMAHLLTRLDTIQTQFDRLS